MSYHVFIASQRESCENSDAHGRYPSTRNLHSPEMGLPCDWQMNKQKISERGQYLLETGQLSDCKFIVGQEPHQQTLEGHKLFLAMSSPVFEAMFFGGMAEKSDPIPIQDVQPEAFKALLKYIYTDRVDLGSFELACELCYCAKKYMLPFLVEECTKYLWSDLSPKKACRAYEFAKLFEEPILMDKCLHIICSETSDVLKEASWEDVEFATLVTVLEQEELQISSEIELFSAVERWAKAEWNRKSVEQTDGKSVERTDGKSVERTDGKSLKSVIGNALFKIRFLALTPEEFADGPGMSPLLTQDEAFAILMNILCKGNKAPMPEGFSTSTQSRAKPLRPQSMGYNFTKFRLVSIPNIGGSYGGYNCPSTSRQNFFVQQSVSNNLLRNTSPILIEAPVRKDSNNIPVNNPPKCYCLRSIVQHTDCLNTNVLDCSVTFRTDKNICVMGVQVPTQIGLDRGSSYNEILYAHLLDSDGSRLTYTHFTTKVNMGNLVEITFNRPVYIQKHKVYRVGVVFNKVGWYPIGDCTEHMSCDSVFFSFGVGDSAHSVRDGLIRSIVFTSH